jgi:hypothetical protein
MDVYNNQLFGDSCRANEDRMKRPGMIFEIVGKCAEGYQLLELIAGILAVVLLLCIGIFEPLVRNYVR